MSGDLHVSYLPEVFFSKDHRMYVQVGPDPKNDGNAFVFKIEYCKFDDTKTDADYGESDWKPCPLMPEGVPAKDCPYFALPPGTRPPVGFKYMFRVYMHDRTTRKSLPKSDISAVITLPDDDE